MTVFCIAENDELRKKGVTMKLAMEIKEEAGSCWQELGIELNLPEGELRNIGNDYTYSREKGFAVIQSWRDKKGRDATVGFLADALENIGKKRIADYMLGM